MLGDLVVTVAGTVGGPCSGGGDGGQVEVVIAGRCGCHDSHGGERRELARPHRHLGADEHPDHVIALGQTVGALDRNVRVAAQRAARGIHVADLVDQYDARHRCGQDAGMWKVNMRSASIRA